MRCVESLLIWLCDGVQSADHEVNQRALSTLGDVLLTERCGLTRVDMEMNALDPADAVMLQPALAPVPSLLL